MGQLRLKANECGHKEGYRRIKEQFVNSISDEEMMIEIIREPTAIKETNKLK